MQNSIVIKGARQHNLKNLDLILPRNKIIVITGPSGSGKSSLAMDTIFAEAQRRYLQSLPIEARNIFQFQKPDIDFIDGLSPAISVDQKTISRSPRSTVGTITEVYDYLRLLYAKIGIPYCPRCGRELISQDINKMADLILDLPHGTKIQILAPVVVEKKGQHKAELERARAEGFIRARIDGNIVELTHDISLKKHARHTIELVVDRIIVKEKYRNQIKRALELAMKHTKTAIINIVDEKRDIIFSTVLACPACGTSLPDIDPRLFSFNSKYGACPRCRGLGYENIEENEETVDVLNLIPCKLCKGKRLRQETLAIKIGGKNIAEVSSLTIEELKGFLSMLSFSSYETAVAERILKEIFIKLEFLNRIGVGYLTLDRPSFSLSGGEAQRIRLATQLGSHLSGVLYILDEPSIGLHPKDCTKLIESFKELSRKGNTLIVVEHDESTILNSDLIIELGPGGGRDGGYIITAVSPQELLYDEKSITAKYLKGSSRISIPERRRKPKGFIKIVGAQAFNLKNIDVEIPIGVLVCVTGVAGSGKSTLIFEVLYKALAKRLYNANVIAGKHKAIEGVERIDKVVCIDQSPIGRTTRSTPSTYTQVMTEIRELFSMLPDARVRGYTKSRFSFNLSGGRCEACQGEGMKKIKMHLLPDVYVLCDVCKGNRYNEETLQIKYRGKNINDILQMTVSEALEFFSTIPKLKQKLQVMQDIGLGYITLGQPATTLSGGEAQRIKLSRELSKKPTGKTLYILDEPTTGLHMIDIERLLNILQRLVDTGNTVIVIEHDLDIIKCADYIIDLGPEGGAAGGYLVASGTPEEVTMNSDSYTGKFLKEKLGL